MASLFWGTTTPVAIDAAISRAGEDHLEVCCSPRNSILDQPNIGDGHGPQIFSLTVLTSVLTRVLNWFYRFSLSTRPAPAGRMVHGVLLLLLAHFIQPATKVFAEQERYVNFAGTAQAAKGLLHTVLSWQLA